MKPLRANFHSQSEGKLFEDLLIVAALRDRVEVVRMPLGARAIGSQGGKPKLIPVKTPFDFVFVRDGAVAFLDAKSTSKKAFAFGDITPHQVYALAQLEKAGATAGYIIHFRKLDSVVFFPASDLAAIGPRDSLDPADGIQCGSIDELILGGIL